MKLPPPLFFISLTTRNQLTILQRVLSLLSRHRVVVEQITLCGSAASNDHHVSLTIRTQPTHIHKLVKQLARLIDVTGVHLSMETKITLDKAA